MKQILQDLAKGGTAITHSPSPSVSAGQLLINTSCSLISAGTERMLVDFGKASLLDKARQQPEKVKMVLEKVQADGLLTTLDAVRSKLGQPLPLGYCNVGVIQTIGNNVDNFRPGDRVLSNGPHADVVHVAKNICAKIPDSVSDEEASFTVVASIGLQGIRLAAPTLGECVVVTGVGLIGLLTVQLLRAQGCRVMAIDYDSHKLEMAKKFGAEIVCNPGAGEDPVAAGMAFSRGNGVDAVIITASTKSNDPVTDAARMSRKRGRIVLVGVVGLELNRTDFYEKELTFQVSCSYGPGRYDPVYETKGLDFPLPFVRWTEQRNFEAVLDMMASGALNVSPLITHRFEFEDAQSAYKVLTDEKTALGILLLYSGDVHSRHVATVKLADKKFNATQPVLGVIGAGNYASRVLIPAFKTSGAQLHTICTSGGINGVIHGRKSGFAQASTDTNGLITSSEINTVVVVTQHNSHSRFVAQTLMAGKNVFVEKPLAISQEELHEVKAAYQTSHAQGAGPQLMVGFNRRFAPQVKKMKTLLSSVKEPKSFIMTMNAGAIPEDHWTQDNEIGGGRIIGEACHFVDLMRYLADSEIVSVQARRMGNSVYQKVTEDKASIILGFADGSFGAIHYYANGAASFPKERIEVFTAGRVLQLDNFRKLKGFGWPGFGKMNLWRQNKGQMECCKAFLDSIAGGQEAPIPADQIFEVAKISIQIAEQLRNQND